MRLPSAQTVPLCTMCSGMAERENGNQSGGFIGFNQGAEHYLCLAYSLGSKIGSRSLISSTKDRQSLGVGGRQRVFEEEATHKFDHSHRINTRAKYDPD